MIFTLTIFLKEGTPKGEGRVLGIERKQMAYWDIEGEDGNAIIAVVTEPCEGYQETGEGGSILIGESLGMPMPTFSSSFCRKNLSDYNKN